jgi:formamidopyrimidine-DNA glycosylase
MPELPEVETVMRGLTPVLKGGMIAAVQVRRKDLRVPFPKDLQTKLEGQKILNLTRRAKYILIHLNDGNTLVIHLGMSGRMTIIPTGEKHTLQKHDHFVMCTQEGVQIIYNDARRFGMIFLVGQDELQSHKAFHHLGPEPLGNEFSGPVLAARLKNKKVSVKQALLDQRIVVGVGNIYASEALYMAGIKPTIPAEHIKGDKAERLVQCIRDVLTRAIKAGGSTLKDYRHADGELGYFQHSFKVYDRAGEICSICEGNGVTKACIKKIVQSGRSTYFCANTQK